MVLQGHIVWRNDGSSDSTALDFRRSWDSAHAHACAGRTSTRSVRASTRCANLRTRSSTVRVRAMNVSSSAKRPIGVFTRVQSKRRIVDVPKSPDEVEQEQGAEDEIEDTVENHFARRRDDVPAFGHTPCDRVEHRDEGDEGGAAHEAGAHACAAVEGAATAVHQEHVPIKSRW